MSRSAKELLTSEKTIAGFRYSDFLGILLMIIPFTISIIFNDSVEESHYFLFIQLSYSIRNINIHPNLLSTLCAVLFYASLIIRYEGVFRAKNLFEALVSILRTFLNCWVLSSLVSISLFPASNSTGNLTIIGFLNNPQSTLLIIALLLSWLGMKAIAGFSWVLFIVAAWRHVLEINSSMGMLGAVFILTLALSLFLQIKNYAIISDFMYDFRSMVSSRSNKNREEIITAVDVAHSQFAFSNKSFLFSQTHDVKIDYDALDVNKDGIIDEKDILLINQHGKDEK